MTDSLTVIEVGPDRLPVPVGATIKQVRLAKLMLTFDPDKDTFYETMLRAGYSPGTAAALARKTMTSIGVQRATAALVQRQADKARGLASLASMAFESAETDLKELDPRDRLAAGVKLYELAHATGSNLEVSGDGDRWKSRVHRAVQFGMRLTELRLALPQEEFERANQRHEIRQAARMRYPVVVQPRSTQGADTKFSNSRAKARESIVVDKR